MNPTAEERERDRAEAIRLAWSCLEADGIDVTAFVLGTVNLVPGVEAEQFQDRDKWIIWFEEREPPDIEPTGAVVFVDAVTKQARRIPLL